MKLLYESQRKLMEHIEAEHPTQPGEDRFNKKVLALLVEVGECANEQRSWKYWSKDQEPRSKVICHACDGLGGFQVDSLTIPIDGVATTYYEPCMYCEGTGIQQSPLLEEYVDKLHFILEIGIECGFTPQTWGSSVREISIEKQFIALYHQITMFAIKRTKDIYFNILDLFFGLGSMLGFDWEQVTEAYFSKNAVNHQRQENGY
jgi:dimeric dUTPase (all-alpha-NTP-PPase superfamily)